MRTWLWSTLLASSVAAADNPTLRLHLTGEEHWLQLDTTTIAPMFKLELPGDASSAGGEVSYDLGPFRIGVSAWQVHRDDLAQRTVGLFAYRTFRLSRWMRAWISLGLTFDQWQAAGVTGATQGVTLGLSIGTTFR